MVVIGGVDTGGGGGCVAGRLSGGNGRRSGLGCFTSASGRRSGLCGRCRPTSTIVVSGSMYIASDAVELGGGDDLWCRVLLPTSLATLAAAAPARAGFAARRAAAPPPPPPSERRRRRRKHE